MPFQLTILGAGSASPTLYRNQTAQILQVEGEYYLIDCGEGTQLQLLRHKLRPSKLKYIFISHLHGDHYFGLIGLLTSLALSKRTDELFLFGPSGLAEIITIQLKYSETKLSFPLHFREIEPEKHYLLLENEHVTIETIPLKHRIPCSGFLFKEQPRQRKLIKELLPTDLTVSQLKSLKNGDDLWDTNGELLYKNEALTKPAGKPKSYAFCSDTAFNEAIVPQIYQVDLLYHEATFASDMTDWAQRTLHSTATQAALIAQKAQVGQLMIGHFSSRYRDVSSLLTEAKSVFLNTLLAEEGITYPIESQALAE
ncbi:MAG: ribonuclease Z [Spirosomataceae bacterium]